MSRQVSDNSRLEIKFVANESDVEILKIWLKLHAYGFYTPYPDRRVNNVYFDTYNLFAYRENLLGASYRTKVRYRWYGRYDYPQAGTLEVKCKRNYFGWKKHFRVRECPCNDKATWRDIRQNLLKQLDINAKKWLDANPQPVIINRYNRQYFVTRDHKIRVTIDTRQRTYDQRYKPYPNVLNEANIPKTSVMEFKFDRKDRHVATQVIQNLPLRVSRNSKYMLGVKSIHNF